MSPPPPPWYLILLKLLVNVIEETRMKKYHFSIFPTVLRSNEFRSKRLLMNWNWWKVIGDGRAIELRAFHTDILSGWDFKKTWELGAVQLKANGNRSFEVVRVELSNPEGCNLKLQQTRASSMLERKNKAERAIHNFCLIRSVFLNCFELSQILLQRRHRKVETKYWKGIKLSPARSNCRNETFMYSKSKWKSFASCKTLESLSVIIFSPSLREENVSQ